ncbi:type II secretion system F family protein [Parafrankia sp. EUN1f]|uniref:type II secretion system F family protein n=1 Tax=Parafrankia sp. EUN1f TaxID=102897 RepID=UPI001E54D6D7|nr:type II secretion system F family protein [Parafrankia sp. EUN1f]
MTIAALSGALVGYGLLVAGRSAAASRRADLGDDLAVLFAEETAARTPTLIRWASRTVRLADSRGWNRLLRADDTVIAGRTVEAHTASRLGQVLAGIGAIALLATPGVLARLLPPAALPLLILTAGLLGIHLADRPMVRLAAARRQDAALAVAAYTDLVRILVIGGLPLHAALSAAAEAGEGWTFALLRRSLDDAQLRGLPPDTALTALATDLPIPAFADLARTVASALRGASPVLALEARAAAIRAEETARVRGREAAADAQMELPATAVALAFVAFLTYPLLVMINSGVGF